MKQVSWSDKPTEVKCTNCDWHIIGWCEVFQQEIPFGMADQIIACENFSEQRPWVR